MRLVDWLDERLGVRAVPGLVRAELDRPLPAHVNWFHTLGAVALALFGVQALTGVLLALNYTPSMEGAYASVRRITHEAPFGWLARSVHHWAANLLVIVLVLHLATAVWYGAYKKPRELTWASGAILFFLTLAFCLTGYLLPMEQISYWATTVVTDILKGLPLLGDGVARAVRGGDNITDATLSRFTVAHIWILPAMVGALVGAHLFLVHRLGITPKTRVGEEHVSPGPTSTFGRVLPKDLFAVTLAVAVVVSLAVVLPRVVDPPFDPVKTEPGTRPEWYFLPAYQLLKYLPSLWGLAVLHVGALLLILLPWLDRSPERDWRRRKGMLVFAATAFVCVLVVGLLGYVSGRTFVLFGATVTFDHLGWPR
jgi:quinol-cytochrome oxidoreductase complex cytochrome b subunit